MSVMIYALLCYAATGIGIGSVLWDLDHHRGETKVPLAIYLLFVAAWPLVVCVFIGAMLFGVHSSKFEEGQ